MDFSHLDSVFDDTLTKQTKKNSFSNSGPQKEISYNHNSDEIKEKEKANEEDDEYSMKEPKQRPDGTWECNHHCGDKKT